MLMGIKDFLAPTRGRILLFMVIFLLIFIYDTAFAPFPGSPLIENLGTQEGATSFVLYILVLPYILSCLIPALMGLRKRKFIRLASLMEFMHHRPELHEHKSTRQQTFIFPEGTPVEENKMAQSRDTLDDLEASQVKEASPAVQKKKKPARKPKPAAKAHAKPAAKTKKKRPVKKQAAKRKK
jgi:hypothetical protein